MSTVFTPSVVLTLIIVILGILLTVVREWMHRSKAKMPPLPVATILTSAMKDTPSVLATAIIGVVLVMTLTSTPVPEDMQKAFWAALGFFFGSAAQVEAKRTSDEDDQSRLPG